MLAKLLTVGAGVVAFSLVTVYSLAPPAPPTAEAMLAAYIAANSQKLAVSNNVAAVGLNRSVYTATAGIQTYVRGGTNYDWAKLVLLSGGWPVSDVNVTVILRWMRQENGAANWWNRNNPLNNGYGSGGGSGTGSYSNLVVAAQKAAESLHSNPGFAPIGSAFASSASADSTAFAIWWSPWSGSHYANGTHWSTRAVPIVKAPQGAW